MKGPKIRIGKYKKRTGYRRHTGFRASLTQIEIESIGGKARAASAKSKPASEKAPTAAKPAEAEKPVEAAPAAKGMPAGYEDMTVAEIKDAAVGAWNARRCSLPRSSTSRRTRSARARSLRSSRRSANKEGES